MPDAEYILRIILRARDEMANILAKAKTELRAFGEEIGIVDKKTENLNKRFSGMNTRLTNMVKRIHLARDALSEYADEEDRVIQKAGAVTPVLNKQEQSTRRLGDTTRRVDRDTGSFAKRLEQLGHRVARTGDNIAALDNQLRGMAVLGAIVFAAQLNAALIGLGGTMVSVASSAAMAGGAIGGGIVAGVAQALPMIGILAASLVRLNAVFDAVGKLQDVQLQQAGRQDAAGRRTADTANQVANSQDGLADAIRGVTEAEEEHELARDRLTEAMREGRREIEDLMLAERQAFLTEEEAQRRLTEARRAGRFEEVEQLQIDRDRARIDRERAVQDAGSARRGGVRGLSNVQDARRGVDSAREGVRDAERAVVRANRAVEQARRGSEAATADTFAAASALQYMLAQLSPAERQLYNALRRVRRAWNENFRPITDIMIGSFERATNRVTQLLKRDDIIDSARDLSDEMSNQFDRVWDSMTNDRQVAQFQRITRQGQRNLKPLGDIAISIGKAFTNIAEAAGPSLNRFIRFFRDTIAEPFEAITENRDKMTDFFNDGERHLESWVRLALSFVNLIAALIGVSAGEGLISIESATKRINEYAAGIRGNSKEAQEFFENAREATGQLWRIVEAVAEAMFDLFQRNPDRLNELADVIIEIVIPALVMTIDHVGDLMNILLAFMSLPIISDLAKWGLSFLLFAKVVTGMVAIFNSAIGLTAQFIRIVPGLDRALTGMFSSVGRQVTTARSAFGGLGQSIRSAFTTRSFRPIIDFLRDIPGRIRRARGAATAPAPQVGGAVVGGRRGPQAPAGAGIDPRRGPQAPAPIVAPVPRRRRIPGGGLARGVGGGLAIYGLLEAMMADEETFGQLSVGERFQKGASTATLGILPGLKTTDDRVKVIIERIRELKRVVQWDEVTGDWDDFSDTQQKVIRRTVQFHNEVVKLRDRFRQASVRARDLIDPEAIQGALATMERMREGGVHTIQGMRQAMRHNFELISEGTRQGSETWYDLVAKNFGAGIDTVLKNIKRGEIGVRAGMKEIDRITRTQMKFARDNMEDLSGEARDALAENFRRARIAVTRQAGGIENATGRTLARIRRLMRLELELYGMPPSLAKRLAEARSQGDLGTSGWGGPEEGSRGAGGGRFGLKGERGKDGTSSVATGRGEIWVANAAQQGYIDDALHRRFGFGFDRLVSRVKGAHAGELGFGYAGGFAGRSPAGYRTVPIPGFGGEFIAQRVLGEAMALIRQFKLFVTDAFATSGHQGQGHLHFGTAMDVTPNFATGGSWDLVDRAVNFFRGKGGTVLYNETAGHGRGHHAHFEMADGIIRGAIANARRLKRRINRSIEREFEQIPGDDDGGVMGGIGKQASRNVAEGAIRRFRRAIRSMGPSYSPGHAPEGALSEPEALSTFRQAFKLALPYAGHSEVQPGWLGNLLNLAREESSLRPGAVNRTSAGVAAGLPQGILQVVVDTFKAYMLPGYGNPFNALHNAIASIRYQLSRYGTIQRHAPYAMGGEIPGWDGQPVGILAHAKEWVVNKTQQSRLAQWVGTSVDNLRSMLGFHGGPEGAQGGAEVRRRRRFRRSEVPTDFGELSFSELAEDISEIFENSVEFAKNTKKGTERYQRAFNKLMREGGLFDQLAVVVDQITTRLSIRSITSQFARRGGRVVQRIRLNAQGIDVTQEHIARLALDNLELISITLNDQRRKMRRQLQIIRGRLRAQPPDPSKRLEQIGKQLEDAEGDVKKDLKQEQSRLQRRQGRRQDLEGMRNRVRGRLIGLDQSIAENLQARYEAQVSAQQAVIDRINSESEAKLGGIDLWTRVATAVGNEGAIDALNAARRDAMAQQANDLEKRVQFARNIGNEDLARQLEQQVGDLRVTIFESIQQEIATAAERINARAQRRMGRLDLFERMATAMGAVGLGAGVTVGGETMTRAGVFGQRGRVLEEQRAGLQGVLRQAEAAGNMQLVQDLTDQLAELEVAIVENTAAAFAAKIEDVNTRANFSLNINDLNRQIIELNGSIAGQVNQAEMLRLAQERGNILAEQRLALESLLGEARAAGNQQAINDLTTQLLENQVAVLQNTQALNELNGVMIEPQSFSSSAWQWFRQAIFTGFGGVLPQYQVPGAQTGAMIKRGGFLMTHAGEEIKPAILARPPWPPPGGNGGGNVFHFDITEQPTETDYEYLGETIARKVKTAGV